jgi:hypothetical protein
LSSSANAREYYAQSIHNYEKYCPYFIESHGCPEDQTSFVMKDIMASTELSSLMVTRSHQCAIHRDPPTVAPAGIFGRGNYLHNNGQCSRSTRGGNLVIVDGMIRIDRSPFDFVLMDGNYCHAVSNLRLLGTSDEDQHPSRFSLILFSTYRRERMKAPGNYKIDFSYLC